MGRVAFPSLLVASLLAGSASAQTPAAPTPAPAAAPASAPAAAAVPGYPAYVPPAAGAAPGYPFLGTPPWLVPPPATERRSSTALVGGIVMVGLGVTGMGIGTAADLASADNCSFVSQTGVVTRVDCGGSAARAEAMAILVVSGLVAVGGIPLWLWGSDRVPKGAPSAVSVGFGTGALTWSF